MNESCKSLISNAISELSASGVEFLTWDRLKETPDFKELGRNRGLRIEFHKWDIIHAQSPDKAVFFASPFKASDGKTYNVLKTLCVVESKDFGTSVKQIPAAIFCRIPSLDEEKAFLWKDNALGLKLAECEADFLRLKLICEIGDIEVTYVSGRDGEANLHTDRWYTDKETNERVCVKDSPDLPESERATIRAYKYKALSK